MLIIKKLFGDKLSNEISKKLNIFAAFYVRNSYVNTLSTKIYDFEPSQFTYKTIDTKNYKYTDDFDGTILSDYNNLRQTLYDDTIKSEKDISNLIIEHGKFPIKKEKQSSNYFNKVFMSDETIEKIMQNKYLIDINYHTLPIYIKSFDELPFGNIDINDLPDSKSLSKLIDKCVDFEKLNSILGRSTSSYSSAWSLESDIRITYKHYKKNYDSINDAYKNYEDKYIKHKKIFDLESQQDTDKFISLKNDFKKSKEGLITYIKYLLNVSSYPNKIKPHNFQIEYDNDEKIVVIELNLPDFEQIEITKIGTKSNKLLNKSEKSKLIDDVIYFIPIRVLYEIFKFIPDDHIQSIALNGKVKSYNKSTGNIEEKNIMSLLVKRDQIINLNLKMLDPKECFKSLKGISASKISEYIPIKPIIEFKKDPRVRETKDVLDTIENYQNIAAMDWQDFENLISELFSKFFSSDGQEVKVTQSSRDKGVDAIAFDTDPIKGGKIVIQAKRYTNVVDVSAVRDLYGTLMNEGAMKGILVTTANYGKDAYDFVKDKPITLLNGNELLGLLETHGYKFKIDLKEAKKILGQNKWIN